MTELDRDRRVVVAGVGNVLRRDDGFGPAVIRRLLEDPLPAGVQVVDAGVRTRHLAYDLADGVDLVIAVDLLDHPDPPGTVLAVEPDFAVASPGAEGHGMDLHQVWALAHQLGPGPRRCLLVGCVPVDTTDGMGLSPEVGAAVEVATILIRRHLEEVGSP